MNRSIVGVIVLLATLLFSTATVPTPEAQGVHNAMAEDVEVIDQDRPHPAALVVVFVGLAGGLWLVVRGLHTEKDEEGVDS